MIDLWILALGFGLLPFAALLLQGAPAFLRGHEAVLWGLLIGVLAFLGVAHAGAALLDGNALLRYEASPELSTLVAAAGLFVGILAGWRLLGRAPEGSAPGASALVAAAAVFVAIHSFTDGLVLGESYAGVGATGFPLTVATVGGTLLHRFAEGSLIVVPALLAAWRPSKTSAFLLAGLVTLLAVYVPVALLAPAALSAGNVALEEAIVVFGAGLEAGFAMLLLLLGLLPNLRAARDGRWAAWAGIAFALMLLVHFLVE